MAPFFETRNQSFVFLGLMYVGLGLGLVYDVLHLGRKAERKAVTAAADLLFFLLAGLALTLSLVVTGQNGLRLYALLGLVCGGIVYVMGVRSLLKGIMVFVDRRILAPLRAAFDRSRLKRAERKGKGEAGNGSGAANIST